MNGGRVGRICSRVAIWLATGFGLGLIPFASGTFGTLLALPFVWALWERWGLHAGWQTLVAIILALAAIPVCGAAERMYNVKDDGRIVADEFMTFPLCMIGLPWHPGVVIMAFLSFRFFDIAKPWPANRLQRVRGGLGVVLDDVAAALYSLLLNHLLWGVSRWVYAGGS